MADPVTKRCTAFLALGDPITIAMIKANKIAPHIESFNQLEVLAHFLKDPVTQAELIEPANKFQITTLSQALNVHPLVAQNRIRHTKANLLKNATIVVNVFSSTPITQLDDFYIHGELYEVSQSLKVGLRIEQLLSTINTDSWINSKSRIDQRLKLKTELMAQNKFDSSFAKLFNDVVVAVLNNSN